MAIPLLPLLAAGVAGLVTYIASGGKKGETVNAVIDEVQKIIPDPKINAAIDAAQEIREQIVNHDKGDTDADQKKTSE